MRAILVVLLLLGAFLSVAHLQKVFSVAETMPVAQNVTIASYQESSPSSFLLSDFVASIASSSSEVSPTPPPDFCIDVPVLMYHHTQPMEMATLLGHPQLTVDSNMFDEHMRYLVEQKYQSISAEDLVRALLNRERLPPKTILITIDDGYDDNYTYAFSTAKKYKIVINFMIPTDLIGRSGYMTWDHLKEMAAHPYARIYNHTATHAPLGQISPEQIEAELSSSNKAFKEHLGLENTIFTYPYGSFNDVAIQHLQDHGFLGAFSTVEGSMHCRSQVMTLPRVRIGNAPMSSYGF